jgi:hypothetical protein
VAENEIDLTAKFDTSEATKSVKEFGREATKSVDGINDSVDELKKSVDKTSKTKINLDTSPANKALSLLKTGIMAAGAAIVATFTVGALKSFFDSVIDEAIDTENSLNMLNAALQRSGNYSADSSRAMQEFASSMMSVSTIDDDVIIGQIAIAKNFAKTDEQARALVKSAMDLSAATGMSLDQSVEQLGRTLDGTAGRLNETVPALRGVSEEALKAGYAIDIVGEQFAGAAASKLNTFQGAIEYAKNAFGNYQAEVGFVITQNTVLIAAIKETARAFSNAGENIGDNRTAMTSLINNGLLNLISALRMILPVLSVFSYAWDLVKWSISLVIGVVKNIIDSFKMLFFVLEAAGNFFNGFTADLDTSLESLKKSFDSFILTNDRLGQSFSNIVKPSIFGQLDELDKALARIQDAGKIKPIEITAQIKPPSKIDFEAIKKEEKEAKAAVDPYERVMEPWQEEVARINEGFTTGMEDMGTLGKIASSLVGNALTHMITVAKGIDNLIASIATTIGNWSNQIIAAAAQGKEGAQSVIPGILAQMTGKVSEVIGSAFGPMGAAIGTAVGGAIGEMIKLASGDRKEIEAKLGEFFAEVPKVLENIANNMPMVAEKVMQNLPNVLVKVMEAIPAIIMAFANAMDNLAESLVMNSPALMQLMLEVPFILTKAATVAALNIVKGIATGVARLIKEKIAEAGRMMFEKIDATVESVAQFFDGITGFFKSLSFNELGAGLKNAVSGLYNGVKDFFSDLKKTFSLDLNLDFSDIGQKFLDGIGSIFSGDGLGRMIQALVDGFKDLLSKIDPSKIISNIGGKGQGVIPDSVPILGRLATGGVVPKGYPDDNYPAMLTSNEVVIPAATTPNLFSLIDSLASGDQPGNNGQTNDLLKQIVTLLANQQKTIEVKLDRDTLAKAIVSLNKDNRRLA